METRHLPGFSELLRFLSGKATTCLIITCGPPFLKGASVSPQDGVIGTTCPASEKALSAGVRNKTTRSRLLWFVPALGRKGRLPRGGAGYNDFCLASELGDS